METFGLLECLIYSTVVVAAVGQIALAYWLYSNSRDRRWAIVLSPLALFGCSLTALVLYYIPAIIYSFFMIACCFEGTPLRVAQAEHFLYTDVSGFTWPMVVGLTMLGLLAFVLSKFGAKALWALSMGVAVVLAGLWLSWFGRSGDVLTPIVAEAPDVPLYPGSTDVVLDRDSFSWFNWHDISFKAPAEPKAVTAFYKEELPKRGWSLASDGSHWGDLQFLRVDERTGSIWKYKLTMMPWSSASAENTPETKVEMTVTRYPNLDKLPVHPNARDVKTSRDEVGGVYTTTYDVELSPAQVLQWYRITFDNYGWWDEVRDDSQPEGGAHFAYNIIRSPSGYTLVDLKVAATPAGERRAHVRMRAVVNEAP